MFLTRPPTAPAQRDDVLTRLSRARDMLCEVRDERLTVERIARKVGLSKFQLIRQFKAVFGETPHQMRIHSRLDLARQMLIVSDAPVTEICCAVGFSSLGTFSTLFARRVGASPSAFRQKARAHGQPAGTLPPKLYPGCLSLMGGWPE
jgi:AraC-like DNA-binding protein